MPIPPCSWMHSSATRVPILPMLYFAGLAAAHGDHVEVLTDGCAYGSLSMTSYTLGLDATLTLSGDRNAAAPASG